LDVDEIVQGAFAEIPKASSKRLPRWIKRTGQTGTLVVWRKCDKIDLNNLSAAIHRLESQLGRMFRHFIWGGTHLKINGAPVVPIDPLFCHPNSPLVGG